MGDNFQTGYLKRILGPRLGEIVPMNSKEFTIGRNNKADIFIPDPNISRNHCVLKRSENGWCISDLGGVNGTYLNNQLLTPKSPYPLNEGVGIYLGPPSSAPAAFTFLTRVDNNPTSCSERSNGTISAYQRSRAISPTPNDSMRLRLKRGHDSDAGPSSRSTQAKPSTSHSSQNAACSKMPRTIETAIHSDEDLSDCSVSSLDSLSTRIRKLSAQKKKKNRHKSKEDSDSCASPSLLKRELNPVSLALHDNILSQKPMGFSQGSSCRSDVSESLIRDSPKLLDSDSYFPFSLFLEPGKHSVKEPDKNDPIAELQLVTGELSKALAEKKELQNTIKEMKSEQLVQSSFQDTFKKMIEDELMCNICTEIFMKPITLNCSHTFCEYCISEWKKKQKKCPMCREKITSEAKTLIMESYIAKAVEFLDQEHQDRWKEIFKSREDQINKELKKKTRQTAVRGRRNAVPHHHGPVAMQQVRPAAIQDLPQDVLSFSPDSFIDYLNLELADVESDSSSSSEEYGYFGGYGYCYNCRRPGHWANVCPY